jgi:hypothetical protein
MDSKDKSFTISFVTAVVAVVVVLIGVMVAYQNGNDSYLTHGYSGVDQAGRPFCYGPACETCK